MTDTDIHSCGYYCDRHACILAQRNELRDKLFEGQAVKTYSGNKPNYTEPPCKTGSSCTNKCERCGEVNPAEIHTCTPKESFEYWNAVEGWVKIEEVRQHFDTAGCGTIYKTNGEGRVPLYAAPQREWINLTDEEIEEIYTNAMSDFDFIFDTQAKLKEKNSTTEKNIQTSDNND
jgi:hypothetical protein